MRIRNTKKAGILSVVLSIVFTLSACVNLSYDSNASATEYNGEIAVELNGNAPQFTSDEITTESFESYSSLDWLGRCGAAFACIGTDLMPTEERGRIGSVKPSGWQISKYDFVDGKYLYNRCHLIAYQLTGENANERNLITGTRYMNVEGMLPYENMVSDYIHRTNNHVMYRVTPVFEGDNLLADGVRMEALSVEDYGEGISFNVFVFNVQPGVEIDYSDGTNRLAEDSDGKKANTETQNTEIKNTEANNTETKNTDNYTQTDNTTAANTTETYILNTNTKKIHKPDCDLVKNIKAKNRKEYAGQKETLLEQGYSACRKCNP